MYYLILLFLTMNLSSHSNNVPNSTGTVMNTSISRSTSRCQLPWPGSEFKATPPPNRGSPNSLWSLATTARGGLRITRASLLSLRCSREIWTRIMLPLHFSIGKLQLNTYALSRKSGTTESPYGLRLWNVRLPQV